MSQGSHNSGENSLDAQIGQILNDFLDRKRSGEAVSENELFAQHPELADELREHLDLLQDLQPMRDHIDALVEQGLLARSSDTRYLAEIGPYRITGLIGRGGMGIVLQAYEESLDRVVALKILRPELTAEASALARFTREAKAAAALRHPNIVTVYAVGQERQAHYIAMEHVEGPSLADLIRDQGPLPTEIIRTIFGQLLDGLAAAHDAGLIHRDIKPSNILLDGYPHQPGIRTATVMERSHKAERPSPIRTATVKERSHKAERPSPIRTATVKERPRLTVKIADFGLARVMSSQTRMTLPDSILGTPEYMSPEQARGDDDIDHRTDLYSAGVVLYEMLTGRPPFRADTPTAVIHQILHNDPPDPRTVAPRAQLRLSLLAVRLMSSEPKDRLPTSSKALEALGSRKRLAILNSRRRLMRRWVRSIMYLALPFALVVLIWPIARRSANVVRSPTPITLDDVRVKTIGGKPSHIISALYGGSGLWKDFYVFPRTVQTVAAAHCVDLDGRQNRLVVAGTRATCGGACVFAFKLDGTKLWSANLEPQINWPDCASGREWICRDVQPTDLDGTLGEEIVVLAKDAFEYPTRISILDPRNGKIRSTFWHMGQLAGFEIVEDYFADGHAAVVTWGPNNKLDGFKEPQAGDDPPRTIFERVPVVAVLDPRNMDGVGPPRTDRLPALNPARPFAYAFLDLPECEKALKTNDDGTSPSEVTLADVTGIQFVRPCNLQPRGECALVIGANQPNTVGGALLYVDESLNLLRVDLAGDNPPTKSEEYWRMHWHLIINRD